jgi:hypothetical protein
MKPGGIRPLKKLTTDAMRAESMYSDAGSRMIINLV